MRRTKNTSKYNVTNVIQEAQKGYNTIQTKTDSPTKDLILTRKLKLILFLFCSWFSYFFRFIFNQKLNVYEFLAYISVSCCHNIFNSQLNTVQCVTFGMFVLIIKIQ